MVADRALSQHCDDDGHVVSAPFVGSSHVGAAWPPESSARSSTQQRNIVEQTDVFNPSLYDQQGMNIENRQQEGTGKSLHC